MKIAIDLDNTLLDYTKVYILAIKHLGLEDKFIDLENLSKELIKKTIKEDLNLGNNIWIKFQGICYGKYIENSFFSKNSIKTISRLKEKDIDITIISHKTKNSLCGNFPLQDLATKRIQKDLENIKIIYKESLEDKVDYINSNDFDFLIDDLEIVLEMVSKNVTKINFGKSREFFSTTSWEVIDNFFNSYSEINNPKLTHVNKNTFKTDNGLYIKILNKSERFIRERDNLLALENKNIAPTISKVYPHIIITKEVSISRIELIDHKFSKSFKRVIGFLKDSSVSHKATHNITSNFHYAFRIKERAKGIQENNLRKEVQQYLKNWLSLNTTIEMNNDYCLPDLSKNNMYMTSNTIQFLDYESAGYGSPERSFLNFLHHPHNVLSLQEIEILLATYKDTYSENFCLSSALDIFDLNCLEWCIITYNYNQKLGMDKLLYFFSSIEKNGLPTWKTKEYDFLTEKISRD